MLIALFARDKPDSADVRLANRPAHRAHIQAHADIIAQAGPLLDEMGEMTGSLIILEVPDIATAQAWADADPYALAGLFATVDLIEWNRVSG